MITNSNTRSWLHAIRPAIGPARDEPPTAPSPTSLDEIKTLIIRARNLRVQAETVVAKVENSIEQTMAALALQKQEAERALGEARRVEREEIAKLISECLELGIRAEDVVK